MIEPTDVDKAAKLAQALTATALATINALSMPPAPNYIAAGLAACSCILYWPIKASTAAYCSSLSSNGSA